MQVRPVEPDEYELAGRIVLSAYESLSGNHMTGGSSPWAELLGPGEAGVRMLAVDPSAQGRGVGRALLNACIERACQLGRAGLLLHSTPWMEAAHHLYESAGYEVATLQMKKEIEPAG